MDIQAHKVGNLYLPGMALDAQGRPTDRPRTLVARDLGYWEQTRTEQARGAGGDAFLPDLLRSLKRAMEAFKAPPRGRIGSLDGARIGTMFVLDQQDARTGEIRARTICTNIVTDQGAQGLLNAYNTPIAVGKYLILHQDAATAVASSTISSGAQTSIPVNSGGSKAAVTGNKSGSFISSTTGNAPTADATTGGGIDWSYGTANSEVVSGGATQSSATAIAISSYTVAKTHSTGDNVVSRPQTGDAPSVAPAGAIIYNSSASTSGATGTASVATISGSGIGNRQAVWSSLTFNTSSTAGNYTGLAIVNISTIGAYASTEWLNSLAFPPQTINATQQLTLTSYTIKI